jgi:hypothetical protein
MNRTLTSTLVLISSLFVFCEAQAQRSNEELIAEAESAAPSLIAKSAAIKTMDGRVIREGSNGWTCYPGTEMAGPMCNEPPWDALMAAVMSKTTPRIDKLSVSYMLAGDGDAKGVSNVDPYATEPTADNQWIKEGPHLMIAVPGPALLRGLSSDPKDPVYVMWKDTPYAHIMVKLPQPE